jgi:hypothetical protein
MSRSKLYTIAEAAEKSGLSQKALRSRLDRGRLGCVKQRIGGRERRMIPEYALAKAGLLGDVNDTKQEREAQKLVQYLSQRPGQPFTTYQLRRQLATYYHAEGVRPVLAARQSTEAALGTLRTLGLVSKSFEPPPTGTGRPRAVWRWQPVSGSKLPAL